MQDLAQQPGQQRDKGHADQGNAAARDQLLHALALAAGVILSITLQQVDAAPDTQGTAQTDHDRLQSIDCAVENSIRSSLSAACSAALKIFQNAASFGGCIFIRQVDFVQVKTFVLCDYLLPLPAQGR